MAVSTGRRHAAGFDGQIVGCRERVGNALGVLLGLVLVRVFPVLHLEGQWFSPEPRVVVTAEAPYPAAFAGDVPVLGDSNAGVMNTR